VAEYVSEELVGSDFTGDGAEGLIGLAEIFREQVVGDSGSHGIFQMLEVFFGFIQG
jgi:hypothetical protein